MSKLFRRKGGGSRMSLADDDMTISSAFSIGNSSVSDRIMGRMRKNLGGLGGSSSRNFGNVGSSPGSGASSSGMSSRGMGGMSSGGISKSSHGLGRERSGDGKRGTMSSRDILNSRLGRSGGSGNDSMGSKSMHGLGSGGAKRETMSSRDILNSRLGRSGGSGNDSMGNNSGNSRSKIRSLSPVKSPTSSRTPSRSPTKATSNDNMTGGLLGEMTTEETMALMKKKPRHTSAPILRPGQSKKDRFGGAAHTPQTSNVASIPTKNDPDDEPVEFSLTDLRSMSEYELEQSMLQSGVTLQEIDQALNEANDLGGLGASIDTVAADQRINVLVALFVNSGRVKLVRHDSRRSTITRMSIKSSSTSSLMGGMNDSSNGPVDVDTVDDASSIVSARSGVSAKSTKSAKSTTSLISGFGDKSRKSKLEKIMELQTENSEVKRENKSLKKTVKKLLGQMSDMVREQNKVRKQNKVKEQMAEKDGEGVEGSKEEEEKEDDGLQNSGHSMDGSIPESVTASRLKLPNNNSNETNDDSSVSVGRTERSNQSSKRRNTVGGRKQSADVDSDMESQIASKNKLVTYLKKKLGKEKEDHQKTEFRLKAEIEILSNEVTILQRELTLSLETSEESEKRALQARELSSTLKHKLRGASNKVSELREEAEARDKLIDTFTGLLLQRVGVEKGDGLSVDGSDGGAESLGEQLGIPSGLLMA